MCWAARPELEDGDEVNRVFLPLLLNRLRLERLPFWLAGMALWMATGAVLAQEGGSVFAAPAIAARAAVLMNPTTGEILFAKEPRLRLPPASTTKLSSIVAARIP